MADSQPPAKGPESATAAHADGRPHFADVFREHYPYVVRLATSLTGDFELAKDIAQDVFVAVFKGLRGFRGDAALRTWIYQITLRISGRHSAKHKKHASQQYDLDGLPGVESADSTASLTELVSALNELPLASRTVLSLVAIEGLSHQAAAEVLGIPVGTVWSRLHTARRQLAAALHRTA